MPARFARPVRLIALLPIAAGLWLLLAGVAAAQESGQADPEKAGEQLEEVERALERDRERAQELEEEAEALRAEIEEVRSESVEVAASVQDLENEITQLELLLAVRHVQALRTDASLDRRKGQLGDTLAALQRISVFPRMPCWERRDGPRQPAQCHAAEQHHSTHRETGSRPAHGAGGTAGARGRNSPPARRTGPAPPAPGGGTAATR
ncbi:hypothetical protein [Fodinicurvata halophila]|uniref:hypothetical protein n=1 Tax=Fodinicurvata halophila TaxID=1419723 RepID=UPI00363055EA